MRATFALPSNPLIDAMAWIGQRLHVLALFSSHPGNVRMSDLPSSSHARTGQPDGITEIVDNVRTQGDALIAQVHGEIDLNRSPDLRGHLLRIVNDASPKPKRLVLNLADVPYMDSSAIAVLVQTLQLMNGHKGQVCLTNVQPRVKGILEIARLESIFKLFATEADALK